MLSRTADHLYWMSRYMERAENTARMLDVSYQASLLPQTAQEAEAGWSGLLNISELMPAFLKSHQAVTARNVMHFMVRDEENLSSILCCLRAELRSRIWQANCCARCSRTGLMRTCPKLSSGWWRRKSRGSPGALKGGIRPVSG